MKSKKNFYISSILTATAVLAVLTVFFGQNVTNQKQDTRTQATVSDREVKLSLFPKTQNTSVGENVSIAAKVLGTGNRKIASILLSVKFDSSHIRLQTIDESKKADGMNLLKVTDAGKANSSGSFKILYGAEAESTAPQGVVNLPMFSFEILKNAKSEVQINTSESQIIFVDGVNGEVKDEEARATVDSTALSPSLSPTPTIFPTSQIASPESTTAPTRSPDVESPSINPSEKVLPTVPEE